MTSELLTTRVDLTGLMTVLGEHLYSTRNVAIRELVQNAHDSCTRRRLESEPPFEPRIEVSCDLQHGTLVIVDNGAGLTRDEIVEYLATVGRGYTGKLRREQDASDLIGAFGLGFLSAYFVSDRVELFTTSYQDPTTAWHFASRGGEQFQLGPTAAGPIGTRVVLHLKAESRALADSSTTAPLLQKYCGMLNLPIHMDGRPINMDPPWRTDGLSAVRLKRESLEFAQRFEGRFKPLCTLPVDDGGLRGLLWIQDGWTYGTSDQRNVSVYVRGMLVDDDARELVPDWAGFVGGVIESDRLTPTASREDLQRDAAWHDASRVIREGLIDGLARLPDEEPATWSLILKRHSELLLGSALCDDRLFGLLADVLRVPTTEGDLPVSVVMERSGGRIHVSMGEQGGYEEVLFRAMRVPVVIGTRYAALPFCLSYAERHGGSVVQLGTEAGNRQLFPPAKLESGSADDLRALLSGGGREVILSRFQPATLPAVLVPDRDAALKRRVESDDTDRRMSQGLLSLVKLYTDDVDETVTARLYVNVDSPVIQALANGTRHASEAAALVRSVAELMSSRSDDALEVDVTATLTALNTALLALVSVD